MAKQAGEMPKVQSIALTKIKPYWRNPRDNNDEAVNAVAKSISEYGFNSPIVLDKDHVIIAGHTRYKAAQVLELTEVPAVVLANLPADKVREYRIADNKTSEFSQWNENLIPELRELVDLETMQVFFGPVDVSSMLIDPDKIEVPGKKSQEDIEKRQKELANKFDPTEQEFIEATCPHCMESFNIDKEYVLSRLGMSDDDDQQAASG